MLVFRWASIYCTGGHNSLTHWITDWNGRLTISHVWQFSHYLPFILSDGNYLCGHHDHNSQSGHPSQNGYSGQFGHSGQSYQSGHPGGFGHHGWCSHPGGLVSLVTLVSLVIQVSHISLVSPVSLATLCMVYNLPFCIYIQRIFGQIFSPVCSSNIFNFQFERGQGKSWEEHKTAFICKLHASLNCHSTTI